MVLRNYIAVSSTPAVCNTVGRLIIAFTRTGMRDTVINPLFQGKPLAVQLQLEDALLNKLAKSQIHKIHTGALVFEQVSELT